MHASQILKDKVTFITGGSSGIGKAAAELFSREGCRVAVMSRSQEEIEAAAREIETHGSEALPLVGDVSKPELMVELMQQVVDRWGRLDIVFANAGVNGVWAPIEQLEIDEWDQTLKINLSGTFYTIKAAVPHLKKNGGSIIITSSINGTRVFSNAGASAYASSKAGQVALAKMLALELAPQKIRVNVICPGAVETQIDENTEKRGFEQIKANQLSEFPEGELPLTHGEPGNALDVAQLALFLASDASRFITGTEVWIDGAESLLRG